MAAEECRAQVPQHSSHKPMLNDQSVQCVHCWIHSIPDLLLCCLSCQEMTGGDLGNTSESQSIGLARKLQESANRFWTIFLEKALCQDRRPFDFMPLKPFSKIFLIENLFASSLLEWEQNSDRDIHWPADHCALLAVIFECCNKFKKSSFVTEKPVSLNIMPLPTDTLA